MSRALHSTRLVALFCLAGAVLFWGMSFAATKTALSSFSPMAVIWLRMVVASVVFAPFWRRLPRPNYHAGDWKLLALSGLLVPCLYYLLEGYAVCYTTSGQAGVVSSVVPLLAAVGAWIFLKERLSARSAIAIGISLVGVAMLSLGGTAREASPNPVLGNVLEFMAMASYAGSMLVIKHLGTRYGAWLLTGLQCAVGVVFFLPGAFASSPATWMSATPIAWASVLYLGVAVSLGAFGLYNTALLMMPAGRAALAINLVPAVAMLTGWLTLGETMSPVQLAASAVIIGAVVIGETGAPAGETQAVPVSEVSAPEQA